MLQSQLKTLITETTLPAIATYLVNAKTYARRSFEEVLTDFTAMYEEDKNLCLRAIFYTNALASQKVRLYDTVYQLDGLNNSYEGALMLLRLSKKKT